MNLWLIVPAKPFNEGKSRLADTLLPSQRAAINKNLLTRILNITNSAGIFTGTIVISRSEKVLEHAGSLGAVQLLEEDAESKETQSAERQSVPSSKIQPEPRSNATSLSTSVQRDLHSDRYYHRYSVGNFFDRHTERDFGKPQSSIKNGCHRRPTHRNEDRLNRALKQAQNEVTARGADALLVLPTDLPLLTVDDINQLYTIAARQKGAVLSCSHDGGTNALLLRPPNAINFAFGKNSFQQHHASIIAAGYPCETLESPTLAFDLDGPEDWERWQKLNHDQILG